MKFNFKAWVGLLMIMFLANTHVMAQSEGNEIGYPGLFQGAIYPEVSVARGSSSFQEKGFVEGNLKFEGYYFSNLDLMYDVYLDELVLLTPDENHKVLVNGTKVHSFDFPENRTFVKLHNPSLSAQQKKGYYELLADGPVQVLIKHSKEIQIISSPTEFYKVFSDKAIYYLHDGFKMKNINRRKDALEFFGLSAKEFRAHASRKLSFKRQKNDFLLELIKVSEKINNQQHNE
ncbi:hypothetical protein [Litoribacter populi]|uniref:hypothetical protein n=1 Tax=Litoribacter populi TaxID=2598460 RepID=UPI001180C9F5|nr:hypothetical protein [Litoribacter populi]